MSIYKKKIKFVILQNSFNLYYIDIEYYMTDENIAKLIGIPLEQYQQELLQFNGVYFGTEIIFHLKEHAQKALDYIIEKYGVILTLAERG
jgi:hypothetical protein